MVPLRKTVLKYGTPKPSHNYSPFLVDQNLYYRILALKLVNQKKELQWRL